MKIFDVSGRVDDSGEYILGASETGSHACYMMYGVMKPGEKGRALKPGSGHEEIVLALQGDLFCSGQYEGVLKEGHALHLKGEETIMVENRGTAKARYVISGGHSEQGHS